MDHVIKNDLTVFPLIHMKMCCFLEWQNLDLAIVKYNLIRLW